DAPVSSVGLCSGRAPAATCPGLGYGAPTGRRVVRRRADRRRELRRLLGADVDPDADAVAGVVVGPRGVASAGVFVGDVVGVDATLGAVAAHLVCRHRIADG